MNGETKKILITVKAYPNPSKTYEETVCVAGIDIDTGKWMRLYPVPYRDLDEGKKFAKYTVIQVKTGKPKSDSRPESHKVDIDSIKILEHYDTKDKWARRKAIVLPTVDKSMCEILHKSEDEGKSLGVFKPKDIDFVWEKAASKDAEARKACYAQLSFFNQKKKEVEGLPHCFRYRFKCNNEPDCPGHDYPIIDWEIGQAYRDWRHKYKPEELLLSKIRERWLTLNCSPKNDVYFFVGNQNRFRKNFMILGVFYPPLV
jgi:hypothetical protein